MNNVAEFGPVTTSHLLLAILLMKDYIATISDVGRDLFIDDLETLVNTMKSMKHSNAFDTIRKIRE